MNRSNRRLVLLTLYAFNLLGLLSASAQTPLASARVNSPIPAGKNCVEAPAVKIPGVPPAPPIALPDLTGTYSADDGGLYYMQQSGSVLWWAGLSIDPAIPQELQWHRGLNFTHIFNGTVFCDGHIQGQWADVPRGVDLRYGTLNLALDTTFGGTTRIRQTSQTGGFGVQLWIKRNIGLNDLFTTKDNGLDLEGRFMAVLKNPASQDSIPDRKRLIDHLKPYRDQTVVYGHIITISAQPSGPLFGFNYEAPHVNYGVVVQPNVFNLPDFGHKDRGLAGFCTDQGDGDFDFRLKLEKMEPAFYTTGWGDRDNGPAIFKAKFEEVGKIPGLNFLPTDSYLGLEAIMYGKPGFCNPLDPGSFDTALLPGWADQDSNSVLINGRPINGAAKLPNARPNQPCIFIQPCPVIDNSQKLNNGIQLGKLLLTAKGGGTYVRITGALILDCGHGATSPCFDELDDMPSLLGNLNQEIHPIYSIDIINYPFRPEDANVPARNNLTGVWGGPDGSTYYLRQIGSTIWWLGQIRDRQPMQRGTDFPIIGTQQLAPAFAAGDPPCPSLPPQCWAFATVFTGTITAAAGDSEKIQGTWAGVPQSSSAGSSGGRMTFVVDPTHKMITPEAIGTIFPPLTKLYEPDDATPPKSLITVFPAVPPAQPSGAHRPAGAAGGVEVQVAKQVSINATDQGSGVQNLWYRFYREGTSPRQAFTFVQGPSVTFILSGSVGTYGVDFYATDNAGNDETPHSATVTLQTDLQ